MSTQVLFVCTGNICRSPLAEALLRHYAVKHQLGGKLIAISAGVQGYHIGDPPDPRTRAMAKRYGIDMNGQSADKLNATMMDESDYIFAMDSGHLKAIHHTYPQHVSKTHLFLKFVEEPFENMSIFDVLDPYYGEEGDFHAVHLTLDRAVKKLIEHISKL